MLISEIVLYLRGKHKIMTKSQVFYHITSPHKWFVGYCSASYATELKQKFEDNRLGEKAIERLFNHFGYEVKTEEQWEKK